jgi:hypothetical protein
MRLKVLLPTRILVDEFVTKVIAEAEDGEERYLAVDEGALVKCGTEVRNRVGLF